MNAREVIKALEANGWMEARLKGSHEQFRHPERPELVTVPVHGSADIKKGVLASIQRQSGVLLRKT